MNGMARMPVSASFFPDTVTEPVPAVETRQPHDPVGMWYAARKQHGVDDRMWFGLFEGGHSMPQWHTRTHRYSDGLGGLALLLRENRGHDCGALPTGREQEQPGWREVLKNIYPLPPALKFPRVALKWKSLHPALRSCRSHVPVSLLLSVMQTRAIENCAKAAGVSSTVWLLWTADRALRETLADADSVSDWVFPVNLRGAVKGEDEFTNHCSGFGVKLTEQSDAVALKQQIASRFARLEHWRQWALLTLGNLAGQRGINLLFRVSQGRPGAHAGSYSNLGEWNVPGLDGICCSAPGSPAYPVAVSTVLCNGRRSLACRLHPVIGGNNARAIEFLKRWRKHSLGLV